MKSANLSYRTKSGRTLKFVYWNDFIDDTYNEILTIEQANIELTNYRQEFPGREFMAKKIYPRGFYRIFAEARIMN